MSGGVLGLKIGIRLGVGKVLILFVVGYLVRRFRRGFRFRYFYLGFGFTGEF